MESSRGWPRFEEPLRKTLARNGSIAALVGAVAALLTHDLALLLPFAALAVWPSLGGHYIELGFLNGLRPRIPHGRLPQIVARVLAWWIGGVLLYGCMVASARGLAINGPPPRLWWYGGFLFIGIELVVHAVMAIRGLPHFYDGRG